MVSIKARKALSLKEKMMGLIGKGKPENLLLKTRFGIHTFGVKFPIDVLILDRDNKTQYIKKNLQPNRMFFWNPRYDIVIELPAGTIKKKGIKNREIINLDID